MNDPTGDAPLKPGDKVKQGEVLLKLDTHELETQATEA